MIIFVTILSYMVLGAEECTSSCQADRIEQLEKSEESLQKENRKLELALEGYKSQEKIWRHDTQAAVKNNIDAVFRLYVFLYGIAARS